MKIGAELIHRMNKSSIDEDYSYSESTVGRDIELSDVLDMELMLLKTDTSRLSKAEIETTIQDVKKHFKKFLICRKKLVLILGYVFEKFLSRKEDICEEIKNSLSEEIASNLISRRDIERYCLDGWKKRTKPTKVRENDNLSFSENAAKTGLLINQALDQSTATFYHGKPSPATIEAQPNSPQHDEREKDRRSLDNSNNPSHSCMECKLKESRITNLHTELAGKAEQITLLQEKVKTLTEELKVPETSIQDRNNVVSLYYPIRFNNLRLQMEQMYKRTQGVGDVWLSIKLDTRTIEIIGFKLSATQPTTTYDQGIQKQDS